MSTCSPALWMTPLSSRASSVTSAAWKLPPSASSTVASDGRGGVPWPARRTTASWSSAADSPEPGNPTASTTSPGAKRSAVVVRTAIPPVSSVTKRRSVTCSVTVPRTRTRWRPGSAASNSSRPAIASAGSANGSLRRPRLDFDQVQRGGEELHPHQLALLVEDGPADPANPDARADQVQRHPVGGLPRHDDSVLVRPGEHRDDEVDVGVRDLDLLDDAVGFGPRAVVGAREQRIERHRERRRERGVSDDPECAARRRWVRSRRARSRPRRRRGRPRRARARRRPRRARRRRRSRPARTGSTRACRSR